MPRRNPQDQEYEEQYDWGEEPVICDDDDGTYYPPEPMRMSRREWIPDLGDEHTVACLYKFTVASLLGRASFRDWSADNSTMTDREKMIVKSLRLVYIRPMGVRCIEKGCRGSALWWEPSVNLYACSIEHVASQLKRESEPKENKKEDKLKKELYDAIGLRSASLGVAVPGSSQQTSNEYRYTMSAIPDEMPQRIYGTFDAPVRRRRSEDETSNE